ncbi:MAG: glycosyltransferase family 4 protein [Pseudomonadota bacterium]
MRILIVYRHFWPDTPPYASMLRTIAAHLATQGHDVEVWTEMPSYKLGAAGDDVPRTERLEGVTVRRMRRLPLWRSLGLVRTLAKVVFPARIVLRALGARLAGRTPDLLVTATIPPVLNGAGGALAARILGCRLVYHFQDIYPELGVPSGLWPENGVLYRLMMAVDRRTCRRMSRGIVLSEDMAQTITDRGIPREKLTVINNFMLDSFADTAPVEDPDRQPFQVIFAGNIGRFQGLEALIDAARLLKDNDQIEIVLLGEGAAKDALQAQATDLPSVRFRPHMPFEQAQGVIAAADVGLVSLTPGIYRMAYPSKTLTYWGLGVPVLAVIEPDSALAQTVREAGVGIVADGRDGAAIAAAILDLYARRAEIGAMRARAKTLYQDHFSRDAALAAWDRLIAGEGAHG